MRNPSSSISAITPVPAMQNKRSLLMNMEKLGQIQLPAPEDFDPHPPSAAQWTRHSRRRDLPCALSGWMAGNHHRNELGTGGARLLVHLHPRFYPHLSHRSVRKGIGRDTISIKYAANKYYILCFLLDTSYILWYNAPVNEFCAISPIGAWT